jgi:uncharacterized membrane protein YhhN
MFGVFLFLTYYLQENLGYSARSRPAWPSCPWMIWSSRSAQLANNVLLPQVGPRWLVPAGMLLGAGGHGLAHPDRRAQHLRRRDVLPRC